MRKLATMGTQRSKKTEKNERGTREKRKRGVHEEEKGYSPNPKASMGFHFAPTEEGADHAIF